MSSEPLTRLRRFLRELKRRNVYQVAVTYLVAAFVVLQLADLAAGAFAFPAWFEPMVWVMAGLGFPLALVVAWAFEMTPEGVRRTPEAEPVGDGEEAAEEEAAGAGLQTGYKALLALGLVAAAAAGGWYLTDGGGETSVEVSEGTVAVLPFEVSGSGADDWRGAMVSLLSTNLDGAGGIRTIADRTVFAALEEEGAGSRGTSTEEALAVARGIGAQYAVVGSASQLGGELQLTARLHATASGDRLEQVSVSGPADSITSLTDSLTRRILAVIVEEGEEIPSVDLASLTTRSVPALKSFLAGERHLRAGEYEAAIDDYRSAVESDTAFAFAHARLALSYWWAGEPALEREEWRRAEASADRLPRRERRLVRALYLARTRGRSGWGADSLRRLTDSYPDDPTVWYSLGEILWHEDVPGGWPEADTAFARAVELDPGHALYYPHYAQLAIAVHHDSALAARRIAKMPDPKWREYYQIPLDLAFGDSAAVRAALARFDSLPLSDMLGVGPRYALRHPEEGDAYMALLERILRRAGSNQRTSTGLRLFRASLAWGRIGAARSWLDTLAVNGGIGCYLSASLTLGLPVPESLYRSYLEPADLPVNAPWDRIRCAGIYLIEKGRAEELDALVPRIREAARSGGEDSVAPGVEAEVEELKAYRAWKSDDPERAVRLFPGTSRTGRPGSIWRGDVHRALGQLEKAERWYRAAWTHPVAHERLGQLYEEMGEPEKAAAAYRRFIAAWKNADPELQPRVEAARERLQELTGSQADPDD